MPLGSVLTMVVVHHILDGLIHPDHCRIETQSGNLLPQDRRPALASKSHLDCHIDIYSLCRRLRFRRRLPMWNPNQLPDQGSIRNLHP